MKTIMAAREEATVITDLGSKEGILLSNLSLPWAKGEPNNLNNAEECLSMTSDGELADVSCSSVYPYFCYNQGPKTKRPVSRVPVKRKTTCGTSDNGYTWEPRTGSCYKFHREALPWQRSAMVCTRESATLAVINCDVESQVLKELYAKNPSSTHIGSDTDYLVHIGFLDWNQKGNWLTVFGDTLAEAGYGKWGPNEPNNIRNIDYCGSISVDALLNDCPCFSNSKAFICEITPKQN